MLNAKPFSNREATERLVKQFDSNYKKADLANVDESSVQLDKDKRKKLLCLLTECEDSFDRTMGKWDTIPIDLYVKLGSKPFNDR